MRHAICKLPVLAAALLMCATGCGEPDAVEAQQAEAREYRFAEANPHAPIGEEESKQLQRAFRVLKRVSRDADTDPRAALAAATLERITTGDVLLGSIQDSRGRDRWHMCRDFELSACEGRPTRDADWIGDDEVADTIDNELDGYMWGNRLYFSFFEDREPSSLAATLVHEVNHILNRSECSYYEDIDQHRVNDTLAYIEEYRAFLAECFFAEGDDQTTESCSEHAAQQLIDLEYGLQPDLSTVLPEGEIDPVYIAEAVVEPPAPPAPSFGLLVPEADSWPDDFGPCAR
jgi:hypothetical protein